MALPRRRVATLRARWLGQLLRGFRETNGLTMAEAGRYLQRDIGTMSRFESGEYPARRGDVLALLDLYEVTDQRQRAAVLDLVVEVWRKGWWAKYASVLRPPGLIDLIWLESRAKDIRTYEVSPMSGLLQTPEYAETVMRAAEPEVDDQRIQRWVELRIERQHILYRDKDPVRLRAVVDEAVLRRAVGGPEVMADQLAYLLACMERPTIDIRVLPFDAGAHASPDGSFRLLRIEQPFPEVAYMEGPAGSFHVESVDAGRLGAAYDRLWISALEDDASKEFVATVERVYRQRAKRP
jgi:transcriptional regulator with XRE-family HTH domain